MSAPCLEFSAVLWAREEPGGWHFVTIPEHLSHEIREASTDRPRAFGSVRAQVSLGSEAWSALLFWEAAAGTYALPIRWGIREALDLHAGDEIHCRITLSG